MLFGDRWQRAVEGADRRLRWPAPHADQVAEEEAEAVDDVEGWDAVVADDEPAARFGGGG